MIRFAWGCVVLVIAYTLLKTVTAGDATPLHTTWTFLSTLFHGLINFVDAHFPTNI